MEESDVSQISIFFQRLDMCKEDSMRQLWNLDFLSNIFVYQISVWLIIEDLSVWCFPEYFKFPVVSQIDNFRVYARLYPPRFSAEKGSHGPALGAPKGLRVICRLFQFRTEQSVLATRVCRCACVIRPEGISLETFTSGSDKPSTATVLLRPSHHHERQVDG